MRPRTLESVRSSRCHHQRDDQRVGSFRASPFLLHAHSHADTNESQYGNAFYLYRLYMLTS